MKTSKLLFGTLPLLLAFILTSTFSAAQVKRDRQVSSFNAIDVGSAIHVVLKEGSKNAVSVEAEEDLQDKIVVKVEDNTLKLRMEDKFNWKNHKKVTVYVTTPSLHALDVSGAAQVKAESKFKADLFKLEMSGASQASLQLEVQKLEADISSASQLKLQISAKELIAGVSGASQVDISGNSAFQKLDLSGASVYEAYKLDSKKTDIEASGASQAEINVSSELSARLSGASNLEYKGSPTINNISTHSASNIRKTN